MNQGILRNRLLRLRIPRIPRIVATLFVLPLLAAAFASPDTPVADAAERGDIEAVTRLLRSGGDVNAAQGDGMTALHWAAERGDAVLAEVLLYAGANVDVGTRIGHYTPLHIAARRPSRAVAESLLSAGADPNARTTNSGSTPLHLAAASGAPGVVEVLLGLGADADARASAWGQTPLIFAAAGGRTEVIRVLLDAGADPSLAAHSVDAAEYEAADRAAERRLAEFLAEFKKQEGGGVGWQPTPSQVQAAVEAAREIQRKWPDVPQDDHGSTEDAPEEGSETEEEEVLADTSASAEGLDAENATNEGNESDEGNEGPKNFEDPGAGEDAEPDSTGLGEGDEGEEEDEDEPRPLSYAQMVGGWGGLTALHHAVRQGYTEAALALLDGGADVNQPTVGDQTTPLLMAAVNGQFDLAMALLDRGANPNGPSAAGATPLFAVLERTWAPRASYAHPTEHQRQNATHLEVMTALLEAGADPNIRLASHLWYMEYTFGVLRGSGIDMVGATPFWRAAYALDVDAMRLLKEYGAHPNIPTMKPPERRRRPPPPDEEAPGDSAAVSTPDTATVPSEGAAAAGDSPTKVNAEGESDEEEDGEEDEEEDKSGVPPVPVGGPAIFPIHAASGVGYGQSFAGNAHRYVPGNWVAAVKFLVEECGAEVDARDANAFTALHHAASRGDNELIRYLVERGADVTVVSRKGQTTADMANGPIQRVPPYPETIALLESLGSKNSGKCVSC